MICNGRRIDAFELWCWRRLLRVPWTARRSNQFILKEINPENSLEGLTLKLKLWSFGHLMQRTDAFELWYWRRLMSLLDCKIKPVNPKGNQPWKFTGRTDVEAEAPTLWPPDVKSWFTGKDPDAGKDWRREEKGTTEDEIVGWHHQLNKHDHEQALGDGKGQGSLAHCSLWGSQTFGHDWATEQQLQRFKTRI